MPYISSANEFRAIANLRYKGNISTKMEIIHPQASRQTGLIISMVNY